MSNSAVTPVSFSTKYYQMKTLSANFSGTTPATEVTALTFNNVTIGKTYRITFVGYIAGGAGHLWMLHGSGATPTDYSYWRLFTANISYTYSKIFTANASTVKFYYADTGSTLIASDGNSTPAAISGGSTKTTYAILEELNDTVTTTSYT